jgi:hypothetical protein
LTSRGQPHVDVAVVAVLGRGAAARARGALLHAVEPPQVHPLQPVQLLALDGAGPGARADRRRRAIPEARPVLASGLRAVAYARAQGRTAPAPRAPAAQGIILVSPYRFIYFFIALSF